LDHSRKNLPSTPLPHISSPLTCAISDHTAWCSRRCWAFSHRLGLTRWRRHWSWRAKSFSKDIYQWICC
jgi:hypothetical protein